MEKKTHEEAMVEFGELMKPCFGAAPTSGAVVVIVSQTNVSYVVINMSGLEVVSTLHSAADSLQMSMTPLVSETPRTMQ